MKQNPIISLSSQKSPISRLLKLIILLLLLNLAGLQDNLSQVVIRKSKIEFTGLDSMLITADHYYSKKENPYVILLHTESSSRGEYDSIAERFVKMRYNCLVVDLRTGEDYDYIKNETAIRARNAGLDPNLIDAQIDILSAIEFVRKFNPEPVILLGSSSTATLAIKTAAENSFVKGVMAFSPGEFFYPEYDLNSDLEAMNKPVFITGNSDEKAYLDKLSSMGNKNGSITSFMPPPETLGRGSSLLQEDNPARDEYWMAVLIFIRSFKTLPDGEVSDNPV